MTAVRCKGCCTIVRERHLKDIGFRASVAWCECAQGNYSALLDQLEDLDHAIRGEQTAEREEISKPDREDKAN